MDDPVTLAIATAVATGAVTKITESATDGTIAVFKSLCKAVFQRFRSAPAAQEALDDARLDPDDPKALAAVAEHLELAEREDPQIRRFMGELRQEVTQEGDGAVHNSINGNVSDTAKVIQGRDFHGNINL